MFVAATRCPVAGGSIVGWPPSGASPRWSSARRLVGVYESLWLSSPRRDRRAGTAPRFGSPPVSTRPQFVESDRGHRDQQGTRDLATRRDPPSTCRTGWMTHEPVIRMTAFDRSASSNPARRVPAREGAGPRPAGGRPLSAGLGRGSRGPALVQHGALAPGWRCRP